MSRVGRSVLGTLEEGPWFSLTFLLNRCSLSRCRIWVSCSRSRNVDRAHWRVWGTERGAAPLWASTGLGPFVSSGPGVGPSALTASCAVSQAHQPQAPRAGHQARGRHGCWTPQIPPSGPTPETACTALRPALTWCSHLKDTVLLSLTSRRWCPSHSAH